MSRRPIRTGTKVRPETPRNVPPTRSTPPPTFRGPYSYPVPTCAPVFFFPRHRPGGTNDLHVRLLPSKRLESHFFVFYFGGRWDRPGYEWGRCGRVKGVRRTLGHHVGRSHIKEIVPLTNMSFNPPASTSLPRVHCI